MPKHQFSLELIERRVAASVIKQRARDGYINATQLCSAAGRRWHQYVMLEANGQFIRTLARSENRDPAGLTETVLLPDGLEEVWVHPQVAIHLAQWLSSDFAVQVSKWVFDWMSGSGNGRRAELPYHLRRHMANNHKVPPTHFAILQEMTITLIAPLEAQGYSLPDHMLPDISQGRMFCRFAREELGLDTDALPTYRHTYPDGREVDAKLYPVEHLGAFRTFINTVWMPERAAQYFRERDPAALPYLDKLVQLTYTPAPPAAGARKGRLGSVNVPRIASKSSTRPSP